TDALEHTRPVVQRVREHVHPRFVPRDELAVHPDLVGRLNRHQILPAIASPISAVVPVRSSDASTAPRTRAAASVSPRNSNIIAADTIAARGSAWPVPAMSGAEPCTGS